MVKLGSHLSVAGGYHKAADRAGELGFEALQIFSHSPSQWITSLRPTKPTKSKRFAMPAGRAIEDWIGKTIDQEAASAFRAAVVRHQLYTPVVHNSYLINLCASDPILLARSRAAMIEELCRADALGAELVVSHPGSKGEHSEETALRIVSESLDVVFERTNTLSTKIALENTAGQGGSLGWRFEQLAAILQASAFPDRLAVCFDTCHAFAAGYPLSPAREFRKTMDAFEKLVGFDRLKVVHLNDSKKGLGSRVDRHEHIGRGFLGDEPFRLLLNDKRFSEVPLILETAKEPDPESGRPMDLINAERLQSLMKKPVRRKKSV